MLRLMCVTAHPDDEAADFGGSLRLYHDRGVETFVVCLTPGQAGSHRGGAQTDHELAEIRRQEFAASCEILKVSRAVVLDYPDGKLHRQDLYRVVCEVTQHVREFRPHVMLTPGPEGSLTGHTDHSMASTFTTLAFHWAGRSNRYPDQLSGGVDAHRPEKLYYATADSVLPGRQPISLSPATAVVDIGEYLETKISAFKAHGTQEPLWPIFEANARRQGGQEKFHLAASVRPGRVAMESDLFEGVE
jgi:LmbE family N-acetylglucosaminyl deacetylase